MDFEFWVIATQIVGFTAVCIILFVKSYSAEKGKNLATKEDVGEITQIVESIKTSLAIKTEELKSDLLFKNEHLIHLRAAEREAIINYYKATWVLVLNIQKSDLTKFEIDEFVEEGIDGKYVEVSDLELRRYVSEAELSLNKIKEDLSDLRYLQNISESELKFFYDATEINSNIDDMNLSLSQFERNLVLTINLLLQIFRESIVKLNSGHESREILIETKRKRSEIITKWYEDSFDSLLLIRNFNNSLKSRLHNRLKGLTN